MCNCSSAANLANEFCQPKKVVANPCQTLVFAKKSKCGCRKAKHCGGCPPRLSCGGLFRFLDEARCDKLPSSELGSF